MSNLAEINCPVCLTKVATDAIFQYDSDMAANHFCPPSKDLNRNRRLKKIIEDLWNGGSCSVYQCSNCGFGFGVPFVGGNEAFYDILHEQAGYPSWRWDYDFALEHIKNENGRFLDIGAGDGKFLSALDEKIQKYAFEASDKMRAKLKNNNISSYKDWSEIEEGNDDVKFTVITMFQVLEHIADFRGIIRNSYRFLVEQGLLIITVPDVEAMIQQERYTGCADMPPNHINKWSPKSLSLVLEEEGFKVISISNEPASIKNLIGKLHLILIAKAYSSNSLISRVYSLKARRPRIVLMGILAGFELLKNIFKLPFLVKGGAFGVVAKKI